VRLVLVLFLTGCVFDTAGVHLPGGEVDASIHVDPPEPPPEPPPPDPPPPEPDAGDDPDDPDDAKGLWEECDEDQDCESGLCHDFHGGTGRRCTVACERDEDCPDGMRCGGDVCRPSS
jgi:hypothetical protein